MSMNWKGALAAGAVLSAGILAACSDSATAPSARPAMMAKPSFAVGDPVAVAPPNATELRICKAGDVGGTINITDIGNGVGGAGTIVSVADQNGGVAGIQVAMSPGAGGAVNCILALTANGNASIQAGDFFTVTETVGAGVTSVKTCYLNDGDTNTNTCPPDFFINTAHGWTVVFTNTAPPPPGDEGCTPGYWKQEQHFGSWTTYLRTADFDATFGVNFFTPNLTLLAALENGGGGLDALGRHGVAALLNAASAGVDYAYSVAQVIDIVQGDGAYAGLSVEARKNLLATANEAGCPLARAELN